MSHGNRAHRACNSGNPRTFQKRRWNLYYHKHNNNLIPNYTYIGICHAGSVRKHNLSRKIHCERIHSSNIHWRIWTRHSDGSTIGRPHCSRLRYKDLRYTFRKKADKIQIHQNLYNYTNRHCSRSNKHNYSPVQYRWTSSGIRSLSKSSIQRFQYCSPRSSQHAWTLLARHRCFPNMKTRN